MTQKITLPNWLVETVQNMDRHIAKSIIKFFIETDKSLFTCPVCGQDFPFTEVEYVQEYGECVGCSDNSVGAIGRLA